MQPSWWVHRYVTFKGDVLGSKKLNKYINNNMNIIRANMITNHNLHSC